MTDKKKMLLSAIRLWALSRGMEEITNEILSDGFIAERDGLKTAFIIEPGKNHGELLESIEKNKSDLIYVVTNDFAKRRELIKLIPNHCGILFHGNPFGLGFLSMELKQPKLTS